MTDTLYIVDVFSLMFQVFHGIPMMTSPEGLPTNAVFGFTRDLIGILRDKSPSHLVCAMDSPGPGVRNDIYSEYKANREALPEDLRPQIPMIADVMTGLRIPAIRYDGWEADDVVATLTRQAVESGMSVRIVSSDKDLRQLLGPQVQIFNMRKREFLDAAFLMRDWGVRPDQVIDYQSLVGDSVDNVPGVPLVGPKKARDLLERFGTLDEVLKHADQAPGKKLRENLVTFADQARVSRELVTLRQDLPISIDWESAQVNEPDREHLLELFNQFGFRRLADETRSAMRPATVPAPAEQQVEVVSTSDALASLLPRLSAQDHIAIHLTADPTQHHHQRLLAWGLSWQAGQCVLIDAGASTELDPCEVIDALRPIFEDAGREVTGYAIKHQLRLLARAGIHVARIGMDPLIGDYLLDAGSRRRSLVQLTERYLQQRVAETSSEAHVQLALFDDRSKPLEQLAEFAELSLQLATRITELLEQNDLLSLYQDLERPLIPVLVAMETCGIRVDVTELQRQSCDVAQHL
ncbi:MAG: 5'-3' exonuclease H3TH domain-containing protein, partial [Planctomycetaceae bacterium]